MIALNTITEIETMYLDYFNNFVSVLGFANHYNITTKTALIIIDVGRYHNHNKVRG